MPAWETRCDEDEEPSPGSAKKLRSFGIEPRDALEIIGFSPGEHIVLITKRDMWATWQLADGVEITDEVEQLLAKATLIQTTPANFPREKDELAFRRLVAGGIVQALSDNVTGAQETLQVAENYATTRAAETSRLWYVQVSLLTTFGIVFVGVLSERLEWGWPGRDGSWQHLGMATAFGALGALFSFLSRLRSMHVDAAAGWKAHYGDGFVRIILGALGAFIFAVAIRAEAVMGFLDNGDQENLWLLYVFCVAAGYSERLVPDFLQQVESRAQEKPAAEGGAQ